MTVCCSSGDRQDHDSGGWVMKLQLRRMRGLRRSLRVASTVDAVLLSHPDILHLGALPYAMKQLGLSATIYATEPVHRLVDYVKSFLEWMSTPFQSPLRLHVIMPLLRHVTLLINETDLDNAPPGPKICQLDLLYNSLSRTVQILLCCEILNVWLFYFQD
ncbi:hypothetical protein Bca52824_033284 [Brassica carinata]|uniref:Cleavage and polyadenylation specificity factor subunit 2 n=1 Tax=Brassica carinata TaxID=52824 RepID=A0A8X7SE71_BRACI|nr:hypothetical protein Bca52824_033284 [Brassica carinata]